MDPKKNTEELLSLSKFLAQRGDFSRRKAEELIKKGFVFVNNQKTLKAFVLVHPKKDRIRIKKQLLPPKQNQNLYIMLNKPRKVLTTSQDPKGRSTVMDYLGAYKKHRLFSVGRLDWDSEGLLLLTNDGGFTHQILHPKNKIPKTYLVKVQGRPKDSHIRKLRQGVTTPIGKKKALFAQKMAKKAISSQWVKLIISEGKKHQIRLMFDNIGFPVLRLRRTAIGRLKMNKLPSGRTVQITEKEKAKIFQKPKELHSKALKIYNRKEKGLVLNRPLIRKNFNKNRSSKKIP